MSDGEQPPSDQLTTAQGYVVLKLKASEPGVIQSKVIGIAIPPEDQHPWDITSKVIENSGCVAVVPAIFHPPTDFLVSEDKRQRPATIRARVLLYQLR